MAKSRSVIGTVRQSLFLPDSVISQTDVTVVGTGSIGRWTTILLAQLGIRRFLLIDPDLISEENLSTQGWSWNDLGLSKCSVLVRDLTHSLIHPPISDEEESSIHPGLDDDDRDPDETFDPMVDCCMDLLLQSPDGTAHREIVSRIERNVEAQRTVVLVGTTDSMESRKILHSIHLQAVSSFRPPRRILYVDSRVSGYHVEVHSDFSPGTPTPPPFPSRTFDGDPCSIPGFGHVAAYAATLTVNRIVQFLSHPDTSVPFIQSNLLVPMIRTPETHAVSPSPVRK